MMIMMIVEIVVHLQNSIGFEQFTDNIIPQTSYLGCIFNRI